MDIQKILKALNKRELAENTNISYSRVRNLSTGVVIATKEEEFKIKEYIKGLLA